MMKNRHAVLGRPFFLTITVAVVLSGGLMITSLSRTGTYSTSSFLCTFTGKPGKARPDTGETTPTQLLAILHYATSRVVPQQTAEEIGVTFDVLQIAAPCNFLVFGLGHDSLMWASFNPHGTTLFLEEDIRWVHKIIKSAPSLRVHPLRYRTRLSEADQLLSTYKGEPHCMPPEVFLKGNTRCKLALPDLPDEVYNREWDVILIDGPKGYFPKAPGRMTTIFSAAVMARARVRPGVTHVILHDADRKVEKAYAREFLCDKYLVKAVGRLWHFQIPPATRWIRGGRTTDFC